MPTYSVREYYSYVDEYEVDAPDLRTAQELVSRFADGQPVTGVEQLAKQEFVDYDETRISELDADGNWLEFD